MNRAKLRKAIMAATAVVLLYYQFLSACWCLSDEGMALLKFRERVEMDPFGALSNWTDSGGEMDHCFWFGVQCSNGKVVILNLKDLCLWGTLGPELAKLAYVKSIILLNNSLYGYIPKEIVELKELMVLDLRYNNFSGAFSIDRDSKIPLDIRLDNNKFLGSVSPKLYEPKMHSNFQAHQKHMPNGAPEATRNGRPLCWNTGSHGNIAKRKKLQMVEDLYFPKPKKVNTKENSQFSRSPSMSSSLSSLQSAPSISPTDAPLSSISFPPSSYLSNSPSFPPVDSPKGNSLIPSLSPVLSPSPPSPAPSNSPIVVSEPPTSHSEPLPPRSAPLPSPDSTLRNTIDKSSKTQHHTTIILCGVIGGFTLLSVSVIGLICCRSNKVVTVKPWATGLSGQLQKAFVAGVPNLKLSELETACEDFSNIIGSLPDGKIFKGTLSSGVEIAVTSSATESSGDWSKNLETQFREKIDALSRVNHKNFLNLIGYCKEEEPFNRMMVFEYAPNGTLFEHLHMKEVGHLEWATRLRIAMGIAYCLEHMHQLNPPIIHRNLQSPSVYLTEDYAAKLSDFSFWNKLPAAKVGSAAMELLEAPSANSEDDIYSFGMILFEIITGRLPYSANGDSSMDWVADHVNEEHPAIGLVDSSLESFNKDELRKLFEVTKLCVHPEPKQRPKMKEVVAKLKEITEMGPEKATPKSSPLWWAELEIMSTEAS